MPTHTPYELFRVEGSPFWYVYIRDRQGNRLRKTTRETDKTRAHAVARELERRFADPTYSAAHATTIAVAADNLKEFLENAGRARDTIDHFYTVKLSHIARLFGKDSSLASSFEAKRVDDYVRERRLEGAGRYTISKELTVMRMLLKVARRRGEFDREISQVMPVGFHNGYKPRARRLTQDEAWGLIRELPPGPAHYVAFVLATTARDQAVHRARGSDFLLEGIRIHDYKTSSAARTVPVTPLTEPFARHAFFDVSPDGAVAPGVGSVRHALERACKRLRFEPVTPNDLRRSVAHWFLEAGVPRDVTASFLGHGSTKMLDLVYGKLDPVETGAAILRALAAAPARVRVAS